MPESIAQKAEPVRRATQTRSDHRCHWPGCQEICKPAQFSCVRHWYKIPRHLRQKIWAAYRIGQEEDGSPSKRYLEVVREVQDWIRGNGA